MQNITQEDLKNILNLIARVSNITGQEAAAVAILQQKLVGILETPKEEVKSEAKEETN